MSKLEKYLHKQYNNEEGKRHAYKRTKIVATVGPACDSYEQLLELVRAGANVFRLNFSHGNHEDKSRIIQHILDINKTEPYNIAILADLQGPKLRIGELEEGKMDLKEDDVLTFTNEKVIGNQHRIYISYPNLAADVKVGEKILIDDGKLEVVVQEITEKKEVKVRVTLPGTLLPKKGVNLPDTHISLPSLTEKDMADLDFILSKPIDWIALSFVRNPEDIRSLKKLVRDKNHKGKVIAKIEMPQAIANLRDIIIESDGVMIARGDLGVEMPVEAVPLIQKDIIQKCLHRAKPVIVATQMMESMIERTKPNRSEISDVANAVLEGTDAVMLSAETATGKYPRLVVETMSKIILEIESKAYKYNREDELKPQVHSPTKLSDAICYNACKLAEDAHADAIIGMTQSGYTGFMLSSYRPKSPLYIFTKEKSLVNQLSLSWGVRAFYYHEEESLDDIFNDQIEILKERGFLQKEDVIISTGSTPVHLHLPTNVIKIDRVK